MTTTKKLLREINKTIRNVQTSAGQVISVGNDIYEVVVFTRMIKAINRSISSSVNYVNKNPGIFVARGAPGQITNHDFSYVVFVEKSNSHEIHLGVKIKGFSGVSHEADISVIDQAECNSARKDGREVDRAGCCLAIECKFYSSNLNLHIGRSLIGYGIEIDGPNLMLVTNSNGDSISKLLEGYEYRKHYILRGHCWFYDLEMFPLAEYSFFPDFGVNPTSDQIDEFNRFAIRSIMLAKYRI